MKIVVNMPKKPYNLDELALALEKAKPLPVITNKVLDKISMDIDKAREDLDGYDPNSLGVFASRVDEIIENYKEVGK